MVAPVRRPSRSRAHLGLLVATTAIAIAGCGESSSSSPSGLSSDQLAADCRSNVSINENFGELFSGLPESNGPPPAAEKQQLKDRFNSTLAKPISDLAANPPAPIASDIRAAAAALQGSLGTTGDPSSVFQDPTLQDRIRRVDLYFYDNCSGAKQAADAVEYSYSGLSSHVAAGVVNFKITNRGREDHEMNVFRPKPGVTDTLDQLLRLPREQALQKVDPVAQTSAAPGQSDATAAELKPGTYFVICTVPKGTVNQKQGDGPPHFTLGMKQQFTVS